MRPRRRALRIGIVLGRTGRLAPLGEPLAYVVERFRALDPHVGARAVELVTADHGSTAAGARSAVCRLARQQAAIVICLGGTTVLPVIARAAVELGLPCVSTALPWQVYRAAVQHGGWAYHFCWGLDDIARTFTDLWSRVPGTDPVGLLWNDGPQGTALRTRDMGFLPTASRARRLVDPGGYREPVDDLTQAVRGFGDAGVRMVSSAATTADLVRFREQSGALGLRLVTCSRWLAYPFGVDHPALDRVATVVAWSPRHRRASGVDGTTAARLAADYQRHTGRAWLPLLGLAHALLEVAVHALRTAADPLDRSAVGQALCDTAVDTIAGRLDWSRGPAPGIATLALAGGQWHNAGGRPRLRIVATDRVAAVDLDGELRISR
ncbi:MULTISPECIES: ABC transporter substrate-binding protein [unclassified Saccharothrix]|uniref:ABC transporter substrate-binding protein n=1 Tax=unclassified Saccharothrix TaxID=2593673 RepID=UPI00307D8079